MFNATDLESSLTKLLLIAIIVVQYCYFAWQIRQLKRTITYLQHFISEQTAEVIKQTGIAKQSYILFETLLGSNADTKESNDLI